MPEPPAPDLPATASASPGAEVLALAGRVHAALFAAFPFGATFLGVEGYDDRVPDVTEAGAQGHRARFAELARAAEALAPQQLSPAESITLMCARHTATGLLAEFDAARDDHTVHPLAEGPGILVAVASVTRPVTPAGAEEVLLRWRGMPGYLDACASRLREGTARGRLPVAALIDVVLAQLDHHLGEPIERDPLLDVPAPPGWPGAGRWHRELTVLVAEGIRPALERYRQVLLALRPVARGDDRMGLAHLPGGERDYAQLVTAHTSLPLTAERLHDTGIAAVAALTEQIVVLGSGLGLHGFDQLRDAARAASARTEPQAAMAAARAAIARAERAVPEVFPAPAPPPCRVEPMPETLARAGTAPQYSPPAADGGRAGSYAFNDQPGSSGHGWDLEKTAFHEAVPGHHLQFSRLLALPDLPALQRENDVPAHAEGWGLYAELLADELGLYSDAEQRIGMLIGQLHRAARLVVDTGLNALGWTRARAVAYLTEHVPLPVPALTAEVDRYAANPGQALAYHVGMHEILRLRQESRLQLGDRFTLAGFHAAVLDSGAVPLPALQVAVDSWRSASSASASSISARGMPRR